MNIAEKIETEAITYVKETTLYGQENAPLGSSARSYFETEKRCFIAGVNSKLSKGILNEYADDILNEYLNKLLCTKEVKIGKPICSNTIAISVNEFLNSKK